MRPERNQNRIGKLGRRIVAICLLTACVLALIPTILGETIANWILRSESADKVTLEGTAGDKSLTFHSFVDNPPTNSGATNIFYYEYVEGLTDYSAQTQIDKTTIQTLQATVDTPSLETSYAMSTYFCNNKGTSCKTYNDQSVCYKTFAFNAASVDLYGVTVSISAPTKENVNIFATSSKTLSESNGTTTLNKQFMSSQNIGGDEMQEVTNDQGETYIPVYRLCIDVIDVSHTFSASITTEKTGITNTHNCTSTNIFGKSYDAYKSTASNVKCTNTLNYRVYVQETWLPVKIADNVEVSTADSALVLSGLHVGDTVCAPEITDLKKTIAEAAMQQHYYTVLGFYTKSGTDADVTYTPVSFPMTITSATPTDIWVKWGLRYVGDVYAPVQKDDINQTISSTTVTQSINVNATTMGQDMAFNDMETVLYLSANLNSGTTLNFAMNDGRTEVNAGINDEPLAAENSVSGGTLKDSTASLSNNTRDYTVKLQNDINVAAGATLTIAGHTGNYNNSNHIPTGYIIGNYVALDLNGKTLTVDGNLYSYGYIYDSVGTGKIVVNTTGTLYTPLLLFGMTGLQHTLKSYGMGYCPFEDYNMPYMEALVELKTENVNGTIKSATLYGMTMLYLQTNIGMMNYYMKLFGAPATGTDAPVFSLKPNTGTTGVATVEPTKVEMMSSDTSLTNQCINIKNIFTFENIYTAFTAPSIVLKDSIEYSGLSVDIDTVLDMGRVIFPISSMVDVTLHSSVFDMQQQIIVMPGATLTVDANSTLKFSYYKDSNGNAAQKSFQSVSGSLVVTIYYCASVSKYLSAGIFAPTYNVQNTTLAQTAFNGYKVGLSYGNGYANFWKYYGSGTVNVYGNIEFESGNNADYVLSGNINVRKFKTPNSALMDWNETNLTSAAWTGINMRTYGALGVPAISTSGTLGGGSVLGQGSDYQIAKMMHYFTLPMISNGTAYLFDQGNGHAGTFDVTTGIFAADNGKNYIILSGVDLPDYGDDPRSDSAAIKGLITMNPTYQEVTTMHTDANGNFIKLVTVGSSQYAFYAGTYNLVTNFNATALTCSFDGANFYSGGLTQKNSTEGTSYTGTLTWNAASKRWILS